MATQRCNSSKAPRESENKNCEPQSGKSCVDFLGGSSRKRKLSDINQQGAKPDSVSGYCTSWESRPQTSSLLLGNPENSYGLCLHQTKSVEPATYKCQSQNDQFHYLNHHSGSCLSSNKELFATGTEPLPNASTCLPPQYDRGSFGSHNLLTDCAASNFHRRAHNMLGPIKACFSLPFPEAYDVETGKGQNASHFEELMSLNVSNHFLDQMQAGMCNMPCQSLRHTGVLQQNLFLPNKVSDDMGERICSQEDSQPRISCELGQNSGGLNDDLAPGAATLKSSICTKQNQNHKLMQNGVQIGPTECLGVGVGKIYESDGHGNASVKLKAESSEVKNLKLSFLEGSPKNVCCSDNVEYGPKNDPTHGSVKSDEKHKSHLGKSASVVAEKLWQGSLQLSSSVTVPAVAFFKSGEKLLDTNWGESVEVKGKVKLEAFEKYIQDLPRSRTRGLMVISLCWKHGSLETGLTGMKQVAEGYKKGKRVGYAQISKGIDLYICPRSEVIVTILAKYGFFKGMAVVEDNQDSMIGCLVWRKNRKSSTPVAKKLEPDSVSNSFAVHHHTTTSQSSGQKAAENHLSVTQPAQESDAPPFVTTLPTENRGKNGSASKAVNGRNVHIENNNLSSGDNSLFTASIPRDSSIIAVVADAHPRYQPGSEQPEANLEIQEPTVPFQVNTIKKIIPSSDDDDLPEFDFLSACGKLPTNTSRPSDTVALEKRVIPGVIQEMHEPGPQFQSVSVSSQTSDQLMLPGLGLHTTRERKPPCRSVCKGKSSPMIIFNNDDDMPEWCPPNLPKQALAESTGISTAIPSDLALAHVQNLIGPQPTLAFAPPIATSPPISWQPLPSMSPLRKSEATRLGSLVRAPILSRGFNSSSILGPARSLNMEDPLHVADKRGYRPRQQIQRSW